MSAEATTTQVDVAIIGGGIAGLWTLATLRMQGYQAILIEQNALGGGQSRFAQGIVHGGTKYALTGKLSSSAEAIATMPAYWRDCLAGEADIDLREVTQLSSNQYMWSTTSLSSRLAGFFGSRMMQSRTQAVKGKDRPIILQDRAFKGQVYRLDEPVLDLPSLLMALAAPHMDAIVAAKSIRFSETTTAKGREFVLVDGSGKSYQISAKKVVLTAGEGNEGLLQQLKFTTPMMQRRPLHMVMLKGGLPEALYAHCLGASALPRLTITSHFDKQGEVVWYVGGHLAESEGVARDRDAQIEEAKQELKNLFPWHDFSKTTWSTCRINRAEVKQPDGSRPDGPFMNNQDGVLTCWPTKMSLSPLLTREVVKVLEEEQITASSTTELPAWQHPEYAVVPWQEQQEWS